MAIERDTTNDPVLALAEYWLSADYMHTLTHAIKDDVFKKKSRKAKRPERWHEFRTYYGFWLAALYVVVEGFIELGLDQSTVPEITNRNMKMLRLFRNGMLHFQRDVKKMAQFHTPQEDTMNWAEDLHESFRIFFYDYTHPKALERRVPLGSVRKRGVAESA